MAILHITNGDVLTSRLQALNVKGIFFTWREMLCEGPIEGRIGSSEFIASRKLFLKNTYDIEVRHYEEKFISQFSLLDDSTVYDAIVLCFEYDLFCHINLLGALQLLEKHNRRESIHLVCSGWLEHIDGLKGLSELTDEQLLSHYNKRVQLTTQDRELGKQVWNNYISKDPLALSTEMARGTQFEYLGNCISAHKSRFPSKQNGLNTLENQILKLLDTYEITSKHHLLGYALNYQGYYGYGDMQISRMIDRLSPFYVHEGDRLVLSELGIKVLACEEKTSHLETDFIFGGARKYDFTYERDSHNLEKK